MAEGRRIGFAVPANEVLVEVAHRVERGELKFEPANAVGLLEQWRRRAAAPAS